MKSVILNPPRRVILTVFWSLLVGLPFAGFAAAPTIESVPSLTLDEDRPLLDVPIRIADADSPPESLTLLASSSNDRVLPASGLILQGTGAERRLSIHPASNSNGVAHVTLRVLDPSGLASTQIVPVTVLAVPDAPTIAPIPSQSAPPGTVRFPVGVIVHDPDTAPAEVKIRAWSSRPEVVPDSGLNITGIRTNRTLYITVPALSSGSTAIILEANDGSQTNTAAFVLQVKPADFTETKDTIPLAPSSALDLNADGWLDVYSWARPPATVYVRQLPGGWQPTLFPDRFRALTWGDFDGDGDLDSLATHSSLERVIGIETVLSGKGLLVLKTNEWTHTLAATNGFTADFDLDGDLDALLCCAPLGANNPITTLARNEGTGRFSFLAMGIPGDAQPLAVGDFDQDGDPDALVSIRPTAGFGWRLVVYLNDGSGLMRESTLATPAVTTTISSGGWTDVNGDGLLDVWYQQSYATPTGPTLVVFFQEGGSLVERYRLTAERSSPTTFRPVVWGDFDADGHADFITPQPFTNYPINTLVAKLFRNDGHGLFQTGVQAITNSLPFTSAAIVPGDFNRDGRLDFWASTSPSSYRLFSNTQPRFAVLPSPPVRLDTRSSGSMITFFWADGDDPRQQVGRTYNVRVGTRPGGNDVLPCQSTSDGARLLVEAGNAGARRWATLLLPQPASDQLYWSVQAVDAGFQGGPFATEQRVYLNPPANEPPRISGLRNVELDENQTVELEFVVSDDFTPTAEVRVTALSSNNALFPTTGLSVTTPIDLESPEGLRRLKLDSRQDMFGRATITITARDRAGLTTTSSFEVLVNAITERPLPSLRCGKTTGSEIAMYFDADPYTVWQLETSADLIHWEPVGEPSNLGFSGQGTKFVPIGSAHGFFRLVRLEG